jgi:general secretion pathway protein F
MAKFDYEVLSRDGSTLTGRLQAETEADAIRELERRGLTTLHIEAVKPRVPRRLTGRRRARPSDVALALQELSTMLVSGVPAAEAVAAQANSGHPPDILAGFSQMATALTRGVGFASTLEASGIPLPAYAIQLAKAGEMTGRLGEALGDAARQMEEAEANASEIRNALVYPSVLVGAGTLAVILLFVFVVPKFGRLLERADELPLLAWSVLSLGRWVDGNLVLLSVAGLAVAVGCTAVWRNATIRTKALDAAARAPLLGDWLVEAEIARWASVLAALAGQRVPLLDALDLANSALRFPSRRQRLVQAARRVREGVALSQALEDGEALTPTGYNLIRVGERSGELPAMLASLGRLYTEASRRRIKRLMALVEPMAILIIGSVIGVIILAVVLAITSANDIAI